MIVAQLIAELNKYPPERLVVSMSSDYYFQAKIDSISLTSVRNDQGTDLLLAEGKEVDVVLIY